MYSQREEKIRLWFKMWLEQSDLGIRDLFEEDCVYIESWGPKYNGRLAVEHWFREWNSRGKVLVWDIKQFFHGEGQTAVEWYFKYAMNDSREESFDGVSIVQWSESGKMIYLKEFGCRLPHYNPYEDGDTPMLINTDMWT